MPITFDKKVGQYRDSGGRFISEAKVHLQLSKLTDNLARDFRATGKLLSEKKINLPEFQNRMTDKIKSSLVVAAALGNGGRKNMTQSDWGRVAVQVKKQYQFLNNFAREIERGKVSSNQIEFRASLYRFKVRTLFYQFEKELKKTIGKTLCARILHAEESCEGENGCLDWAKKGFIPIDEQPEIGKLDCKDFCKCDFEYE